jgi:hypothetical protein
MQQHLTNLSHEHLVRVVTLVFQILVMAHVVSLYLDSHHMQVQAVEVCVNWFKTQSVLWQHPF